MLPPVCRGQNQQVAAPGRGREKGSSLLGTLVLQGPAGLMSRKAKTNKGAEKGQPAEGPKAYGRASGPQELHDLACILPTVQPLSFAFHGACCGLFFFPPLWEND